MSTLDLTGLEAHLTPAAAAVVLVDGRRQVGGSICPTCRACADYGFPHLCITRGGSLDRLALDLPRPVLWQLLRELRAHPAVHEPATPEEGLKQVHASWCFCGCTTGRKEPAQ